MKRVLQERRKQFGYTQKSFAEELGISIRTYQNIEQKPRMPRKKLMHAIMEKLKTDSIHLFDYEEEKIKRGEVTKNICYYMNELSKEKKFTKYEVSSIRNSIQLEIVDRKTKKINIASRTDKGKWEIYKRIAKIANERYKTNVIAEDVHLFKICARQEYTDRTGRCTWGIPEVRKKLGFNPKTGY